jgi:hypothetical protein
MNLVVWASLQRLDVLERIDLMLPDIIDEDDVQTFHRKRYSNNSRSLRTNRQRSGRAAVGVALVTIGTLMLVPGPVDVFLLTAGTAVGSAVGIPWLGMAALAIYNVLAIAMIVIGGILILTA